MKHHVTPLGSRPHHTGASPRPLGRVLRSLALMACASLLASTAQAQQMYELDPGYRDGLLTYDRFAERGDHQNVGRKVAVMPNGDVVIAGRVPAYAHQNSTYGSLGLSLRNGATGFSKDWEAPNTYDTYAHPNVAPTSHLTIPGRSDRDIRDVRDIAVSGERIFVLVDSIDHTNNNGISEIYVLDTKGYYQTHFTVAEFSLHTGGERTVWAEGFAIWRPRLNIAGVTDYIGVVYTRQPGAAANSDRYMMYRRVEYKANSSTDDTYTLNIMQTIDFTGSPNCDLPAQCTVRGIAKGGNIPANNPGPGPIISIGENPKLYITGGRRANGTAPWEVFTARIDNNTGAGRDFTLMKTSNLSTGEIIKGIGYAIAVKPFDAERSNDHLYTVTDAERTCRNGARVIKYRPGLPPTVLPTYDTQVVGGADRLNFPPFTNFCGPDWQSFHPKAIDYKDGKIAVAGSSCIGGNCGANGGNGGFAVVNDSGFTQDGQTAYFQYLREVGIPPTLTRVSNAAFYDVVALGNDRYLMAGDALHLDNDDVWPIDRNRMRFTSAIARKVTDDIFIDDFED